MKNERNLDIIQPGVRNQRPEKSFYRSRNSQFLLLLFILVLCTPGSVFGQDTPERTFPPDAEPPPLKVISKEERDQLNRESNLKNRTKLSLGLMDARLKKAEENAANKNYREMFRELGRFHALVDNALYYLNRNNTGSGKVLNNFKRLEIGLREFLPRLELIRRELPVNYEFYVRTLILDVRDSRRKAVDPLFADTVLPDNTEGN